MRFRGPSLLGRWRLFDLILALVMAAIAIRAILAVLPVPLTAERRRVQIWLFVASVSGGMEQTLVRGEQVWRARDGAKLGRIEAIRSRPALDANHRSGWQAWRDILLCLSATGRYQAGRGLYLGRNLPVRVGDVYPLRTTLGAFWGRVERISLLGGNEESAR